MGSASGSRGRLRLTFGLLFATRLLGNLWASETQQTTRLARLSGADAPEDLPELHLPPSSFERTAGSIAVPHPMSNELMSNDEIIEIVVQEPSERPPQLTAGESSPNSKKPFNGIASNNHGADSFNTPKTEVKHPCPICSQNIASNPNPESFQTQALGCTHTTLGENNRGSESLLESIRVERPRQVYNIPEESLTALPSPSHSAQSSKPAKLSYHVYNPLVGRPGMNKLPGDQELLEINHKPKPVDSLSASTSASGLNDPIAHSAFSRDKGEDSEDSNNPKCPICWDAMISNSGAMDHESPEPTAVQHPVTLGRENPTTSANLNAIDEGNSHLINGGNEHSVMSVHEPAVSEGNQNRFISEDGNAAIESHSVSNGLKVLRCQHVFHTSCIDSWLEKYSEEKECPICRTTAVSADENSPAQLLERHEDVQQYEDSPVSLRRNRWDLVRGNELFPALLGVSLRDLIFAIAATILFIEVVLHSDGRPTYF